MRASWIEHKSNEAVLEEVNEKRTMLNKCFNKKEN